MNLRRLPNMTPTMVLYLTLEQWPHTKGEPWEWRFRAMADTLSPMDRLARIESGSCISPFACCLVFAGAWSDDKDRRDDMSVHFYRGGWTYPRFTVRIPAADPTCTTLPWETIHADLMSLLPRENIPELLLGFLENPFRKARDEQGQVWENEIFDNTHAAITSVMNQQYGAR